MTCEADHPPPDLPPLRVHHFLVAMACVGIVAVYQGWSGGPIFASAYRQMVAEAYRIVTFLLQTLAALTLLLLLKWRHWDHLRLQIEPGHCLLLIVFIEFLLTSGLGDLYMRLGNHEDFTGFFHVYDMLFRILPQLLVAAVCVVAYRREEDEGWRRLFLICLLIAICGALWLSLQLIPSESVHGIFELYWIPWWLYQPTIMFFAPALQFALLAMAIRRDRIARDRRHWTHWCGVITWAGVICAFALMRVFILMPLWFS